MAIPQHRTAWAVARERVRPPSNVSESDSSTASGPRRSLRFSSWAPVVAGCGSGAGLTLFTAQAAPSAGLGPWSIGLALVLPMIGGLAPRLMALVAEKTWLRSVERMQQQQLTSGSSAHVEVDEAGKPRVVVSVPEPRAASHDVEVRTPETT